VVLCPPAPERTRIFDFRNLSFEIWFFPPSLFLSVSSLPLERCYQEDRPFFLRQPFPEFSNRTPRKTPPGAICPNNRPETHPIAAIPVDPQPPHPPAPSARDNPIRIAILFSPSPVMRLKFWVTRDFLYFPLLWHRRTQRFPPNFITPSRMNFDKD